jgi:hypothetical protein
MVLCSSQFLFFASCGLVVLFFVFWKNQINDQLAMACHQCTRTSPHWVENVRILINLLKKKIFQ